MVSQWDTGIINEFTVNVWFEYKLDNSLKSKSRTYQIEYDSKYDVPSRIIITGPVQKPMIIR